MSEKVSCIVLHGERLYDDTNIFDIEEACELMPTLHICKYRGTTRFRALPFVQTIIVASFPSGAAAVPPGQDVSAY